MTGESLELFPVVTDDDAHTGLLRLMEPSELAGDRRPPLGADSMRWIGILFLRLDPEVVERDIARAYRSSKNRLVSCAPAASSRSIPASIMIHPCGKRTWNTGVGDDTIVLGAPSTTSEIGHVSSAMVRYPTAVGRSPGMACDEVPRGRELYLSAEWLCQCEHDEEAPNHTPIYSPARDFI